MSVNSSQLLNSHVPPAYCSTYRCSLLTSSPQLLFNLNTTHLDADADADANADVDADADARGTPCQDPCFVFNDFTNVIEHYVCSLHTYIHTCMHIYIYIYTYNINVNI